MMMLKNDIELLQDTVKAAPQLCSIFDRITPNGEAPPQRRNALTARKLTEKNIVENSGNLSIEELNTDLSRLSILDPEAQADTYFYLLQKYGWRIGMLGQDEDELQDVSLFDSIRTQRALEQQGDKGGYLLVKGDLTGIQNYIYGNIQQKTAGGLTKLAKRLRGRSILVTLLTDFLANVVLQELELPVWNLLFAGGGHFNLLLPDTPIMQTQLQLVSEKLDSEIRRCFDDGLQLIIAVVPCSKEEITLRAGHCFERLNAERERKKYRQHHKNLYAHFFPQEKSAVETESKRDQWEIPIGTEFPYSKYLIEVRSKEQLNPQNQGLELLSLEMHAGIYGMFTCKTLDKAAQMLSSNKSKSIANSKVFKLNDTDFLPSSADWNFDSSALASFGFRFLGKYVPRNDEEKRPETFEEIAKSDKLDMLNMLGAIRLDVDDLGYIFSHGMSWANLGQIVTLSRDIHFFFSAHFDKLAQEHRLYLIYSGGDDAFAVGRWNDLIDFARHLQKDFQEFIFNNKSVHFSAGIFLGDPKYPVGRFYIDADKLLGEAKESEGKNRVHIFHRATSWDAFDKKIEFGRQLSQMLSKDGKTQGRKLTMAFAYRLLTLIKTSFFERTEIVNGRKYKRGAINTRRLARNISNIRYLFARNGYDKAKTDEITEGIEKQLVVDFLRNVDFGKEQAMHDNLVALNYALYTIRSQSNTE